MNRFRFIKVRDVESPSRGNEGDAGLDFYIPRNLTMQDMVSANPIATFNNPLAIGNIALELNHYNQVQSIVLAQYSRILIPSGIRVLLEPRESMLMAANKSGISTKLGLIFTAEVVDSSYTGEIHIGVYNTTNKAVRLIQGQKLIQFIHVPVFLTNPEEISQDEFEKESLQWGTRGSNGFGSTDNN